MESGSVDYIRDDFTISENESMEKLSHDSMLSAYRHHGFWVPMDILSDRMYLEELWNFGKALLKVW
ncbi:MAG: hypothetical protein HZB30_09705 [Nitrospirae bacterium]|nr:hypothetical protein [Nitrospirota bacterium]